MVPYCHVHALLVALGHWVEDSSQKSSLGPVLSVLVSLGGREPASANFLKQKPGGRSSRVEGRYQGKREAWRRGPSPQVARPHDNWQAFWPPTTVSGSGGSSETKCFKENLGVLWGMIASCESKVQIVLALLLLVRCNLQIGNLFKKFQTTILHKQLVQQKNNS